MFIRRSSIHELATLTNLHSLNLIGNNIATADALSAISAMGNLVTLNLSGNPIELQAGYPMNVFALQQNLEYVDNWYRPPTVPGELPQAPMPIGSLEAQLDAANAALSLQERTLSANGHELSKLCASLTPQSTKSAVATYHHLSETEILEKFPYYRMLQLWRKEALNAIMARTVAEQRLHSVTNEMKRERQLLISRRQEDEMKAGVWKQRCVGWEKKCNDLERIVHAQNEELRRVTQEAAHRDAQLEHMTQQMRTLAVYLNHQKNAASEVAVIETAATAQLVEKLRLLEDRLASASERVAFTAEVVAHKELQVRNNLAAADAERRLLQMSRVAHPTKTEDEEESSTSSAHCAALTAHKEGVHLNPEAEALLRAIFRGLDVDDTGTVDVSLLLKSFLVEDTTVGALESKTGGEVVNLTELGVLVDEALGSPLFGRLTLALREMPTGEDLTWGEFLLQLMPSGDCSCRCHRATRCALTVPELRDLRRTSLLGDSDWGLVPLDLPAAVRAQAQKEDTRKSTARRPQHPHHCSCGSDKSVRQLQSERRYLMQRLQEMTRTLERRAEGIKSYFEASIRGEQLKSHRLTSHVADLQHSLEVARERQEELEQSLKTTRERNDAKVAQLTAKIDELNESKSLRYSELQARYEAQLTEEITRTDSLQKQLETVKVDCDKRDFKIRTLQNDVRRLDNDNRQLTAARSVQVGEVSSLTEQLREAEATLQTHLLASTSQEREQLVRESEWSRERLQLMEHVRELEENLVEVQQKLTAAEVARAEPVQSTQPPPSPVITPITQQATPPAPSFSVASHTPVVIQSPPQSFYASPAQMALPPPAAAPPAPTPQYPPLPQPGSGFRNDPMKAHLLTLFGRLDNTLGNAR